MEINATLLGQAITFAILIWFTMKFVWPPLNQMIEKRAKLIADGLADGEKGKQELIQAQLKITEELKQVRINSNQILSNTEKKAIQLIAEAKEKALIESNYIIQNGRNQINQELFKAKEELRIQVASLALQAASKILQAEIDPYKHQTILNNIKIEL